MVNLFKFAGKYTNPMDGIHFPCIKQTTWSGSAWSTPWRLRWSRAVWEIVGWSVPLHVSPIFRVMFLGSKVDWIHGKIWLKILGKHLGVSWVYCMGLVSHLLRLYLIQIHPGYALPKKIAAKAPENWWLEDDSFAFGIRHLCRWRLHTARMFICVPLVFNPASKGKSESEIVF